MSDQLTAAAQALGIPESLVQRSAAARAAETGTTPEEVLASWAGGAPLESAPSPAEPAPTTVEQEPAAAEPDEGSAPSPQPEPEPVPVAAASAVSPAPTTRAPAPATVSPGEAAHLPEVVTVPTAGIRERTNFVIPKWLTTVLLVAPIFALFALGGSATGECGSATELRTDVVSGRLVNCDGSEFTGQQAGGGGSDPVALGNQIFHGSAVAGVNCSTCHGANGQGTAAFPALTGVLTTFSACTDHIHWVTLGSDGTKATGASTYGDTGKPIKGGMPTFGASLTPEQIAAVAAFERVQFGGGNRDEVLVDCGLAEPTEGGGGDGETGGDGSTASTTTTAPSSEAGGAAHHG
jgi:hypothetical protein